LATRGTFALGISGNKIVGYYTDSSSVSHGFLYNGSTYTTLDDPLATPGLAGTFATGISGGNIVGSYGSSTGLHGFIYNGSSYTTLDVPFAGTHGTSPSGISGGKIVGGYTDSVGNGHAFLYNGSTYTNIDPPFAPSGSGVGGISGSNIVGSYGSGGTHGYFYDGSTYTTLDDPLAGSNGTFAKGIDGNHVVGAYIVDVPLSDHGFLATVPEPSSIVMLGLGLIGSLAFVRRRNGQVARQKRTAMEPF
jgi:hypothetical protein